MIRLSPWFRMVASMAVPSGFFWNILPGQFPFVIMGSGSARTQSFAEASPTVSTADVAAVALSVIRWVLSVDTVPVSARLVWQDQQNTTMAKRPVTMWKVFINVSQGVLGSDKY